MQMLQASKKGPLPAAVVDASTLVLVPSLRNVLLAPPVRAYERRRLNQRLHCLGLARSLSLFSLALSRSLARSRARALARSLALSPSGLSATTLECCSCTPQLACVCVCVGSVGCALCDAYVCVRVCVCVCACVCVRVRL